MKKNLKEALSEIWIPISTILLTFLLMWFVAILQGCTSTRDDDATMEKIERQSKIIDAYEEFRTIAVKIYINQVDSTGDGFDESDDGVNFWLSCKKIDDIVNNTEELHN